MNKLNGLKVEKFRILKDAELKAIVGGNDINCGGGYGSCYGSGCIGGWENGNDPYYPHYINACVYNSSVGCHCP